MDIATNKLAYNIKFPAEILSCAFSKSSKFYVVGLNNGNLCLRVKTKENEEDEAEEKDVYRDLLKEEFT